MKHTLRTLAGVVFTLVLISLLAGPAFADGNAEDTGAGPQQVGYDEIDIGATGIYAGFGSPDDLDCVTAVYWIDGTWIMIPGEVYKGVLGCEATIQDVPAGTSGDVYVVGRYQGQLIRGSKHISVNHSLVNWKYVGIVLMQEP